MPIALASMDGKVHRDVDTNIRKIRDAVVSNQAGVTGALVAATTPRPLTPAQLTQVQASLQAGGSHALNVTNLIGTSATGVDWLVGTHAQRPTPRQCLALE